MNGRRTCTHAEPAMSNDPSTTRITSYVHAACVRAGRNTPVNVAAAFICIVKIRK